MSQALAALPAMSLVLTLLVGCSNQRLLLGSLSDGGDHESSDAGGGGGDGDSESPSETGHLKAHVELGGMTVSMVTVGCAGDCTSIQVVAAGGNPPYAFTWQDGSTADVRELCATTGTTFRVEARDTPSLNGEFPYAGQTVEAQVDARVLECPDAGPPGHQCGKYVGNPNFLALPVPADSSFISPPWQGCTATVPTNPPSIWASAEGDSHGSWLVVSAGAVVGLSTAGQELCNPLRAGETVHLSMEVNSELGTGTVRIYGSPTSACGEDELLAETPQLEGTKTWTTQCLTLRPQQDLSFLKIVPTAVLTSRFWVDNIEDVDTCPN